MNDFLDEYMPAKIPGCPCVSSPRFKTSIQVSASGKENRNQNWEHPLHVFTLPEAVRQWDVIDPLAKMWKITRGPFRSFPWRDPHDFASCDLDKPNMVPDVSPMDQHLGAADGFTDSWQLVKTYDYGEDAETYTRTIHLPVLETVRIAMDGVEIDPGSYTVSRPGGVVQFAVPPVPDDGFPGIITAGFLFDVQVRFESDDTFDQVLRAMHLSSSADLTLVEVRPC